MDLGRFEWERLVRRCMFTGPSVKLLALLLATWANEDGSKIHPGLERLMAASGLSKGYVSTQLGKLEETGLIFKVHNGSSYGRRGGLASVYQLTVPASLYLLLQKDPGSMEPYDVETAIAVFTAEEQFHPSESDQQVQPSEQFHSDEEQFHPSEEQFHSGPEQFHPSVTHQPRNTTQITPSKKHQSSFSAASPSVTHAKEPVDNSLNGTFSGQGFEDERRRQMEALQKIIEDEKRIPA
jgi:hypothetical protein